MASRHPFTQVKARKANPKGKTVNATKAIKTYIAQEPHAGEKLSAKELLEFKKSMPDSEYQELGRQAAAALGEPFEEKAAA